MEEERDWLQKGKRVLSGIMEMFDIFIGVVVTWVYTFVTTHLHILLHVNVPWTCQKQNKTKIRSCHSIAPNQHGFPNAFRIKSKLLPMIHKALNELTCTFQTFPIIILSFITYILVILTFSMFIRNSKFLFTR